VQACAARRASAAQLAALEAAVAGAAGLAMVYCAPALRLAPAYIAFLERLAAGGRPPMRPLGGFHELPLCVVPPPPAGAPAHAAGDGGGGGGGGAPGGPGAPAGGGWAVNTELGFVSAPVSATAAEVHAFIEVAPLGVALLSAGGGNRGTTLQMAVCRPLCGVLGVVQPLDPSWSASEPCARRRAVQRRWRRCGAAGRRRPRRRTCAQWPSGGCACAGSAAAPGCRCGASARPCCGCCTTPTRCRRAAAAHRTHHAAPSFHA
jgi:hypothetical protein